MRALLSLVAVVGACSSPPAIDSFDAAVPDAPAVDAPTASPCAMQLTTSVTDAWGLDWDGAPREPAMVEEAASTCAAFGGRLPTTAELQRVHAGTPYAILGSATSATLWSTVPVNGALQLVVDLDEPTVATATVTTAQAYRCVCDPPAAAMTAFASHCHGPPQDRCFATGNLLVDQTDRAAVLASSAHAECAKAGGHLATPVELIEALQAGLVGSGVRLRVADHADYKSSEAIGWTTQSWSGPGNSNEVSHVPFDVPAPFRCAGYATTGIPTPATASTMPLADGTQLDLVEQPAASYTTAHDRCRGLGGHFATMAELARGAYQGLPGSTDPRPATAAFGADQGFVETYYLHVMKWVGTNRRFAYSIQPTDNAFVTHVYQTGAVQPYRCIYTPVAAVPPSTSPTAPAECTSCFLQPPSPDNPDARVWFDGADRPPARWVMAIDNCRRSGGHLASERDLTDAIRSGLGNGTRQQLWTTEMSADSVDVIGFGGGPSDQFEDAYPTAARPDGMVRAGDYNARAYRCMWTNELR